MEDPKQSVKQVLTVGFEMSLISANVLKNDLDGPHRCFGSHAETTTLAAEVNTERPQRAGMMRSANKNNRGP
jgi:hypothetical protein